MASIRSQLQLTDGMSSVLTKINGALTTVLNSFEAMQGVAGNVINVTNIEAARSELVSANQAVEEMEKSLRATTGAQDRFNDSIRSGGSAADILLNKIKGIAAAAGAGLGIKKLIGLSDQMSGARGRLDLIVDDGGSVAALEEKIMASANRSRSAYLDTMQSVSKLGLLAGDAFSGNDEMIRFAELMNKNFVIAGASASEQSNAMYQLNQAMAAGKLQGDEYRSIIDNAPLLVQSIEDYMVNVEHASGTMKDWAAQGQLTADVIKNALFASAGDVEERYNQIPKTWSNVWSIVKNKAVQAFEPILTKINEVANSPAIAGMTSGIVTAFYVIANTAGWVFDLIANVGSSIYENWSWLGPIVLGVAAALAIYAGYLLITNILGIISIGIKIAAAVAALAHAAATGTEAGATATATAAQYGLNAALLACPITWIIIAVIALVTAFYAVIAAINHFAGTSLSATGLICGAFMMAFAFIGNLLVGFWNLVVDVFVLFYNLVAEVANFIGNVFNDPIGSICRLFFALADTVFGVIQGLAAALDTVFGSNLAGAVQGWRDGLGGLVDSTFGKGTEVMAKMNADDLKLGRFEYGSAFNMGDNFGRGLESSVGNLFNFDAASSLPEDIASGMGNSFDPAAIADNTGAAADNAGRAADSAGKTADAVAGAKEDLKYMRDLAERDVINRFTTAEVKIDMTGMTNRIDSGMDLDGVISRLSSGFTDALSVAAEGVHA